MSSSQEREWAGDEVKGCITFLALERVRRRGVGGGRGRVRSWWWAFGEGFVIGWIGGEIGGNRWLYEISIC